MSLRCLMGLSKGKTGGRNSQGRITSFHRGGGSKRLLRKIDLKRSTSSMGIVERIEYDPNRSARIALVRWIEGVHPPRPRHKNSTSQEFVSPSVKESTTTATVSSQFSFASMPGKVVEDPRINVACLPPSTGGYVPVGLPSILPKNLDSAGGSLKTSTKEDLFISALSSPTKPKGGEAGPVSFPRIAVAGAKPAFFAPQMSGEKNMVALCEVQKLKPESIIWQHRIKRQAALSWKSLMGQDTLGLARAAENNVSNLNANQGSSPPFKPMGKGPKSGMKDGVERVPVSYIIASSQLEAGKMVMNCDWSKPSTSGFLRSGQSDANTDRGQGANRSGVEGDRQQQDSSSASPLAYRYEMLDLNSQVGNCIPLSDIRLGTWVHEIECKPGQGAKLVRSAGTFGKIIKESGKKCLVRLPSGVEKFIDSRCRATVGVVSNLNHGARKLRKAGQSRWLGRRPVVRGVAMNPVDHPHGGGEGRTKGGRPSVSPWGKPTKDGYKTASKRKN